MTDPTDDDLYEIAHRLMTDCIRPAAKYDLWQPSGMRLRDLWR